METSLPRATFAIKPAVTFWKVNNSRIVGLLVLGLLIWIIYLLFDLDDFYLFQATIRGNRILSAREIYAAGQVDGQSVFWINPVEVAARVEALPNIKTAQIYLTLPANLTIMVEERQPEVIWQSGDTSWWIDIEGLFVPPRQEAGLDQNRLRIIDEDATAIQANDHIDLSIIRGVQIVHQHKPEVETLYYTRQYGISYVTPEGWPVYLGRSENISAKLLIADALRTDLLARQVAPGFIDVRNPRRAVYVEQPAEPGF